MERKIIISSKYKKDIKPYKHDQKLNKELQQVVVMLKSGIPLPAKYKDHELSGNYKGYRDCHIRPNAVLIYERADDYIGLVRFGPHNKLGLTESTLKLHIKELED